MSRLDKILKTLRDHGVRRFVAGDLTVEFFDKSPTTAEVHLPSPPPRRGWKNLSEDDLAMLGLEPEGEG